MSTTPRMHTTLLAVPAAALALAAGALGGDTALAAPAAADPACPSSLRSVPGGARDASLRGFDDGAPGPDQAYRPGHVLLRLDPGTSQREFDCVLRELGAVRLAGGRGGAGFGGMSNLMLVQLPAGRSVAATAKLLLAPRYRELVDLAQPNRVTVDRASPCPAADANPAPFPNDPLFPWQWGLDQGNQAATKQAIAANTACTAVVRWPGVKENGQELNVGDATRTMRIPQAWPLTKRWYWFNRSVKVGIIDDSLVQHADLEGAVPPGLSKKMAPVIVTMQAFKVTATAGTFTITQGGGDESCDIPFDAAADVVQTFVERRVKIMCDVPTTQVPAPSFDILAVDGGQGSLDLTIGQDTATLDATQVLTAGTPTGSTMEALLSGANAAMKTHIASGDLKVARLAGGEECFSGWCTTWMIARKGALAGVPITANAARLQSRAYPAGPVRGEAELTRSRVKITESSTEPRTFVAKPRGLPEVLEDDLPWTFTPAGAARVVRATGNAYKPVQGADRTWPGQLNDDPSRAHGQPIAGIIGARAGNGIGMAGVLGPYVTPKLVTAVTPSDDAASVAAINYLAGYLRVPVINYSRGGSFRPGQNPEAERELTNPQGVDPRPDDAVQQAMAEYPRTLFVVAAGNFSTNLTNLGPRAAAPTKGEVEYGPCAPKGMGITNPPGRAAAGRADQRKGGALSMLRMPDGTFDRGNILCVASVAPPMQKSTDPKYGTLRAMTLSTFSSWGAGIVDVAAPGEGVIGTALANGYQAADGTSFAAPLVAGVAGLIMARNPGMDASLVKCAILSSATTAPLGVHFSNAELPFRDHGLPAGGDWREKKVLTVPGIVVATEALSAAQHLRNRTSGWLRGRQVDRGNGPTCVQERGADVDDRPGPWINTATAPVPQPGPQPAPAP